MNQFLESNMFAQNRNYSQPVQQSSLASISGGEDAALAYQMAPGTSMFLFSLDTNEMFMRTVDFNGITSQFRAFDITEKMPNNQLTMMQQNLSGYVTKDEFNKLATDIAEMKKLFEDLNTPTNKKG